VTIAGRGREPCAEMDAARVLELLQHLEQRGIRVWLDGGWAVDALLETQTRAHDDLDLVTRIEDNVRIVAALGEKGYVVRYDAAPSCFVLVDDEGHQVDVHPAAFASSGEGVYRMENGEDWIFPAAGFAGVGRILDREVPCLTADVVLVNHTTGYALDDEHERDVEALSRRYGLPVPEHERAPGRAPPGSA
jgi:lincosamide nucleotidyltransferase A/C/D/E